AVALHDLKRVRHVGRARYSRAVALRLWIVGGPRRAVLVALLERLRQIRNRAALDDARPWRHGEQRTEPPEFRHRLGRSAFEVPVSGVHGLPNTVQIRMAVDSRRSSGCRGYRIIGR